MRDVCGNDRPQLFILLEGGAKFHVGVGLSERVGKVAGGLEDLLPASDDVHRNGLERSICTRWEYARIQGPASSRSVSLAIQQTVPRLSSHRRNAQRNDYGNGCTLCSCRIELPGATLVGSYRGGLTPKVEPCCSEEWTICFRAIAA